MASPPRGDHGDHGDRSLGDALAEVRWDFAGDPPVSPLSPAADYFVDFPWDAGPRPARSAKSGARRPTRLTSASSHDG